MRKRVHAHTVGLPEKGTHRELRAFFVRFLAQERASHACVAIVMGLNEVHPSFLDALAHGKKTTADQAAWMVHRLEHGVLGPELAHLANAHDGAYSHGVQANASANSAPRRRSRQTPKPPPSPALIALSHASRPLSQANATVRASRKPWSWQPSSATHTRSAPRTKERARRSTRLKRVRSSRQRPRTISTNTPPPPPPVPRLNTAHGVPRPWPRRIPSPPFPAADTTNWSEFTPAHAASPEL